MAQRATKALYAERLAPDFSVFDFLDTRENGLSRVIAWLLDPVGSHAQGERFVVAFMDWLGLDEEWKELAGTARVRTEVSTAVQRLADRFRSREHDRLRLPIRPSPLRLALLRSCEGGGTPAAAAHESCAEDLYEFGVGNRILAGLEKRRTERPAFPLRATDREFWLAAYDSHLADTFVQFVEEAEAALASADLMEAIRSR